MSGDHYGDRDLPPEGPRREGLVDDFLVEHDPIPDGTGGLGVALLIVGGLVCLLAFLLLGLKLWP